MPKEKNRAYIDGQNLYLGTKAAKWQVDFTKFRIYLRDKYQVAEAYYFMGYVDENEEKLYTHLQEAGFIIVFREHTANLKGKKKGNVDVDIVFEIMKAVQEKDDFDKIVLVSGDGDYIKPVKYLIEKGLFKKIIFPNEKYSSLYKKIKHEYGINLSLGDIRKKIQLTKKKKTEKKEDIAEVQSKKNNTAKNKQPKSQKGTTNKQKKSTPKKSKVNKTSAPRKKPAKNLKVANKQPKKSIPNKPNPKANQKKKQQKKGTS